MPDRRIVPQTVQEHLAAHTEGHGELPAWFDAEKHSAGIGGIVETATGIPLNYEGEPRHPAARQVVEAAAAAETETPPPPTKPRGRAGQTEE